MQRERTAQIDWDYFWSQIQVNGPDDCWPWTGTRYGRGYGRYRRTLPDGSRPSIVASRLAYESAHGPLQANLHACHTCDNPPCCNPAHLFAGTPQDNSLDMVAKGRARPPRGTASPRAKVLAIREEYARDRTGQRVLGEKYGIAQTTVGAIVLGRGWEHVPIPEFQATCHYGKCGRTFKPRHHGQKFCSVECRGADSRANGSNSLERRDIRRLARDFCGEHAPDGAPCRRMCRACIAEGEARYRAELERGGEQFKDRRRKKAEAASRCSGCGCFAGASLCTNCARSDMA